MTETLRLRENWYRLQPASGIDLDMSGIIEWQVEGHGIEVGQATRIQDRINNEESNLRAMLAGQDYHNHGRDFRNIHYAILDAYQKRTAITLSVLEHCSRTVLTQRRRHWLERRRTEELSGGPKVLNQR